jgi:transposase
MPTRFVTIDRDTPLLLAPNLRDWVPQNHLCHFIVDAVAELDLRQVRVNQRGCGSEQYPPSMLMALIIYSYASGVFGSRRIEQATCDNVPTRLIRANTHPDHDTIRTFRRENKALVNEAFIGRKPTKAVFNVAGRPQTMPPAPVHPRTLNRPVVL